MLARQSFGRSLRLLVQDLSNVRPFSSEQKDVSFVRSQKFPNALSAALKKGTGGRSSFNGSVVTVFGSSGFLGSSVVSALCRTGCQVILPYRGDQYDVAHLKVAGDLGQVLFTPYYLRDPDSVYKAVKFSNVVINLVGKFNETPSFSFNETHVDGARQIAKASREAGVNRLVHVSALNASPQPRGFMIRSGSNFLRSKFYGEQAVREEFPEAIIFRPSAMYGEADSFFNYYSHFLRYNTNKMYLWNKGFGIFKQPVFVSDVAEGIVNSIYDNEMLAKTIDAVGCRRYELNELVRYMMRATGRGEEYEYAIEELRTAFTFLARIFWFGKLQKYPIVSWEKLELENHTDQLTDGNPTLQDLGVTLTPFEENSYYELKALSRIGYYVDKYGEMPQPPFPKSVI